MRYEFYGRKLPYSGKTLWEIVANLKNFGVGRLIKKSTTDGFEEPSFLKIIKIQAVPPSKVPFEERFVKAWVEEIFRGVNTGTVLLMDTKYPKFQLIPKIEEEKYYKALEEMDKEKTKKYICKYCNWPPLYKMIWEKAAKNDTLKKCGSIPNLNTVVPDYPGYEIILEDKAYPQSTCSLHKSKLSVEEMYREIVHLKKIIKSNSEVTINMTLTLNELDKVAQNYSHVAMAFLKK